MAKLSISKAWDETREVVARDGKLLGTIALALLVLPGIVSDLVTPAAPEGRFPPPGAWMIVAAAAILIGLAGQLSIIWLAMGSRATVGEAIRHGLQRAPSYIAATFIWVLPFACLIYLLMRGATPEAPSPASGLGLLILMPFLFFFLVRLLLSAPVAAAETGGPVQILKRSWQLTSGNWWRLFGFLMLLVIAGAILVLAVGAVAGIVARLLFGEIEPMTLGELLVSLVTQLVGAVFTSLLVIMLARLYVQASASGAAESSVPSSGT